MIVTIFPALVPIGEHPDPGQAWRHRRFITPVEVAGWVRQWMPPAGMRIDRKSVDRRDGYISVQLDLEVTANLLRQRGHFYEAKGPLWHIGCTLSEDSGHPGIRE